MIMGHIRKLAEECLPLRLTVYCSTKEEAEQFITEARADQFNGLNNDYRSYFSNELGTSYTLDLKSNMVITYTHGTDYINQHLDEYNLVSYKTLMNWDDYQL